MDCSFLFRLRLGALFEPFQNRSDTNGQLGETHPDGIVNRIGNGRSGNAIGWLPQSLGPEWAMGIYWFDEHGMNFRYVLHGEELVVHEIGIHTEARGIIKDLLFSQAKTHPLNGASINLVFRTQ